MTTFFSSSLKLLKHFFLLFCCLFLSIISYSQGCSDAGFCTMGAMRPNQNYSSKSLKLISLELNQYIGLTPFKDYIFVYTADFNFSLKKNYSFQLKLPYSFVRGSLANTNGTGDISLCLTRNLYHSEKSQFNFSIGTKIPTNKASKLNNEDRPLPMYYQTSLGTYDMILGFSWINKNWLAAAGYQMPLNTIENGFTWGRWETSSLREKAREYPVSNKLRRGNDVMLRIERNFRSSKFNAYVGVLGIYRIKKDIITSPQTGKRIKVDGSEGLAATALVGMGYRFSTKAAIKFLMGYAFIQRETNPDGLSRDLVNSISFEYKF